LRRSLYAGDIYLLGPLPASERLVADVRERLGRELGEAGPEREAQFRLSGAEFFARVGRLRRQLYLEPHFHRAVREVLADCGFDPCQFAFDPIRVRAVAHRGFEEPKAAAVYVAHRDTWYGHPQALVTGWVPLHDLGEGETFVFYPDCFARPVPNNSGAFDYDEWVGRDWSLKIGWQDPGAWARAVYPSLQGEAGPGEALSFSCRAGQVLLFAGAHLHQTRRNVSGRTRFSIDFRAVHLGDHAAGLGAPNADNRSRGCALRDYVRSGPPD
jgi:ectoine hydroxylase-related dioxygenase (phytanoyl-CoA dioxygenase family)